MDRKEYMKAYRQVHKEEAKEYKKAYYLLHKEECNQNKKAYYQSHKEERLQKYCCEDISNIENYFLAKEDNFVNWDIHHCLETHNSDGERRLVDLSEVELKALGMYYDRPASELIFMKCGEHISLHKKGKKK